MRILIVEDDPLVAIDLQILLETAGHEVVEVCDRVCSAEAHVGRDIDFALLDVDLPDGKSFGVASLLDAQHVPFVFVSASNRTDLPAHLTHARFIAKPYERAAIIASLAGA